MKLSEIPYYHPYNNNSPFDTLIAVWNNLVRNDGELRCDWCHANIKNNFFFHDKELLCESCYELHNNHSPPDRR